MFIQEQRDEDEHKFVNVHEHAHVISGETATREPSRFT